MTEDIIDNIENEIADVEIQKPVVVLPQTNGGNVTPSVRFGQEDHIPDNNPTLDSIRKPKSILKNRAPRPSRKNELMAQVKELYADDIKEGKLTLREITRARVAELEDLVKNYKIRNDTARLCSVDGKTLSASDMPLDRNECAKKLGDKMNKSMGEMNPDMKANFDDLRDSQNGVPIDQGKIKRKAKTLYNYHLVGGGLLECLSDTDVIRDRTQSSLAGLTKDMAEKKDEFMEVLTDLYEEYHEELDPFLNTLYVYGTFMGGMMTQRWMDNKKKNSKGSLSKSPLRLDELLGLQSEQQQLY